ASYTKYRKLVTATLWQVPALSFSDFVLTYDGPIPYSNETNACTRTALEAAFFGTWFWRSNVDKLHRDLLVFR
ncbi:MAG TPA: hypothetical protein VFM05_06400, partial [Candidatus Saccharimonadales bacterium]|nr:hypothetical protein [Candidatus Saccharimonadales bacterium]